MFLNFPILSWLTHTSTVHVVRCFFSGILLYQHLRLQFWHATCHFFLGSFLLWLFFIHCCSSRFVSFFCTFVTSKANSVIFTLLITRSFTIFPFCLCLLMHPQFMYFVVSFLVFCCINVWILCYLSLLFRFFSALALFYPLLFFKVCFLFYAVLLLLLRLNP